MFRNLVDTIGLRTNQIRRKALVLHKQAMRSYAIACFFAQQPDAAKD
ncbi:MAG: hypothetical protein AB7O62_14375 [Pirellulales bacterium]